MNKKEVTIEKGYLKSILLSLVCSFVLVFIIEHFGKFTFIPNIPNHTSDGQLVISGTYDMRTTGLSMLTQTTPFGNEIQLDTTGLTVMDLNVTDGVFDSYFNKVQLYLKAVFVDYIFLLLIWVVISAIFIFFNKFRLKLS